MHALCRWWCTLTFVVLFVVFRHDGRNSVEVSALSANTIKTVRSGKDKFEGFGVPLYQESDTVIHVGNIDWQLPVDDVSNMIVEAIGMPQTTTGNNDDDPNKFLDSRFDVRVAELPTPRRKRDEGKFHQGSARVSFRTRGDAKLGMEALQRLSEQLRGEHGKELKVRWAPVSSETENKAMPGEGSIALTSERIEHRKKRAAKYARKRKRIAQDTDRVVESLLAKLNAEDRDLVTSDTPVLQASLLDWSTGPEEIDPMNGGKIRKGTQRGERKRAAVEAFLCVLRTILDDDNDKIADADENTDPTKTVADLGCGAGNLTVPLAWWLKQLGFGIVGVDINGKALTLLSERADRLGIAIETLETDLLQLSFPKTENTNNRSGKEYVHTGNQPLQDCVAVVSLHACGAASDLSMAVAVHNELPFAISPCCIGKISTERVQPAGRMPPRSLSSSERSAAPSDVLYPRSTWLNGGLIGGLEDYRLLAAAADYGVGDSVEVDDEELARRKRCKLAKKIIEIDRLQWAKENGYYIRLVDMPRIGPLYPKRELLLGAKEGSAMAVKLSQLSAII